MQRAVVLVCVVAAVVLAYLRLFYGVDVTDEAWYVALPYRFATGAKPYVDEMSVPQTTTGVLLAAPVWVWHAFAGREALVLFMRHVHFLLALALGGVVYTSLRRRIGDAAAAFVAIAAFLFAPFAIPDVSYDSLGAELFAAGCFLPGLAGGVCLGLAAFVYPPLLIAGLVASVPRRQLRALLPTLALPLGGFTALAFVAGPKTIVRDYRRSAHYLGQAGGLEKLHAIAAHEWHAFPFWWLAIVGAAVCAILWQRRSAVLLLSLAPLAFVPAKPGSFGASLEYVAHVAWLGLPLALALREDSASRRLVRTAWVPGIVGGVVTAYSSANGGINFGVGSFPAALAAVALAARAIHVRRPRLAYAPAAVAAALLAYFSLVPVYRDAPLGRLVARVHGGPYAGLLTSARKRTFLTGLVRDLGDVTARCRIAFFQDFPAGYLLTPARVDANAVWTATVSAAHTSAYHRLLLAYWHGHGMPQVVVLMHRIPFAPPETARREQYASSDPLLAALRRYRPVHARRDYTAYRRGRCDAN